MCDAVSAAIVVGGAVGVQSFMESEAARAQNEYQADVLRNNAIAMQQEADYAKIEGAMEQREVDKQREILRREYNMQAAQNRAELSAAGVDLTSGSPLAALTGNADLFAADYAELGRQKQLVGWQTERKESYFDWQSEVMQSQASYLDSMSSFGTSLLTAGVKGAVAGFGTYAAAGGFAGGAASGGGPVQNFDKMRASGLSGF